MPTTATVSLYGRLYWGFPRREGDQRYDARHDTLVIAKKEDAQGHKDACEVATIKVSGAGNGGAVETHAAVAFRPGHDLGYPIHF